MPTTGIFSSQGKWARGWPLLLCRREVWAVGYSGSSLHWPIADLLLTAAQRKAGAQRGCSHREAPGLALPQARGGRQGTIRPELGWGTSFIRALFSSLAHIIESWL